MDRKTIPIIVLCVVLWLLLNTVINKYFPPVARPGGTNAPAATATAGFTNAPGTAAPPVATATPAPAPAAARFLVDTNVDDERFVVLTNENARYTFTSYGGGLKLVELVKYPETVTRKKEPQTGRFATLNAQVPVPTLAILDGEAIQGDGIFKLIPTANGVRVEKPLTNGLLIVKEFSLSTNYLITATVRLENQSQAALSLPEQKWVVGTATPMNLKDNSQVEGLLWYNGTKSQGAGASDFSAGGCIPRTPLTEYRGGQNDVLWAAVHNQFFTLVAMPKDPAAQVLGRQISLPGPDDEQIQNIPDVLRFPKGYEATLVYPALTLAPGQAIERQFFLYAGPKEYRTLARIAGQFNNNVDLVMGFGWFGFFSKALLLGMNWLHNVLHLSYGWAIVAITVIIKLVFWPFTAASTRSMKKMQALAPEVKALREKHKDDLQKFMQKQQELYKKNNVSQLGGCLPTLIQMPVFIGFFTMIRYAIELRGASWLWVRDLSQPDTLFMIPGLNFPFNLLPLIMGGTMLWQTHLAPPSPGMDPMQQKLMRYMPLLFLLFLYKYSSGMALYWTVSNLLTILQTKLTKTQTDTTAPGAKAPALTPPAKKKK